MEKLNRKFENFKSLINSMVPGSEKYIMEEESSLIEASKGMDVVVLTMSANGMDVKMEVLVDTNGKEVDYVAFQGSKNLTSQVKKGVPVEGAIEAAKKFGFA